MRYIITFALMLSLTACDDKQSQTAMVDYNSTRQVDKKFCIEACRAKEFENFHNSSGQVLGGSSSSSMNGLAQSQIYDRVTKECELFYTDVKCCTGEIGVSWRNIYTNHNYKFGQCRDKGDL